MRDQCSWEVPCESAVHCHTPGAEKLYMIIHLFWVQSEGSFTPTSNKSQLYPSTMWLGWKQHDNCAEAIRKNSNIIWTWTVGSFPVLLAEEWQWYNLYCCGDWRRSDVEGKGLVVPCIYVFIWKQKPLNRLITLLAMLCKLILQTSNQKMDGVLYVIYWACVVDSYSRRHLPQCI